MLPYDKLKRGFRNKTETCAMFADKYENIQTETMESELPNFSLNLDFENFESKTPNKRVKNVRRGT